MLQQADLSIHLLDSSPGREMDDAEVVSYPQRQADMAADAETPALLWLPDSGRIDQVEDEKHLDWLASVETASRAGDGYQFQHSSREGLIVELLERIERLGQARTEPAAGPRSFASSSTPTNKTNPTASSWPATSSGSVQA